MSKKKIALAVFFTIITLLLPLRHVEAKDNTKEKSKDLTSTFNQLWLDSVISIEASILSKPPKPIGTGFLVQTSQKHVLLVTAKHVIEDKIREAEKPAAQTNIRLCYRLNTTDADSVIVWESQLKANGYGDWHLSKQDDIACRFAAWPTTSKVQIAMITQDNFLKDEILMAGAPILVLGFPLGLREIDHARPISRHGIVGRADDDKIIADVFVFPGNSGGPVVYSPTFKAGKGLKSHLLNEEKLIGVVSSFIPYREPAVSMQTKRVRIIFEENSGLTNVVPVSRLVELIESKEVKQTETTLK